MQKEVDQVRASFKKKLQPADGGDRALTAAQHAACSNAAHRWRARTCIHNLHRRQAWRESRLAPSVWDSGLSVAAASVALEKLMNVSGGLDVSCCKESLHNSSSMVLASAPRVHATCLQAERGTFEALGVTHVHNGRWRMGAQLQNNLSPSLPIELHPPRQ
jgi:hypothetical protein